VSTLASLIGSGAGIITIALAVLIGRHYRHLPWAVHSWAQRIVIVLMFAGGSAIAVTDIGRWADDGVTWTAGLLGGLGAGLPRAALVVTCMFLLAGILISLIFAPAQAAGVTAAVMPAVLALAPGGFLASVHGALCGPATAFAALLARWIGG
jgi:hypothetical protein